MGTCRRWWGDKVDGASGKGSQWCGKARTQRGCDVEREKKADEEGVRETQRQRDAGRHRRRGRTPESECLASKLLGTRTSTCASSID